LPTIKLTMEEIQYIGELLLPKYIGQFAITFGFVTSLLAVAGYFFATQRRTLPEATTWKKIGRAGFWLHGLSVLAVIATIFYVLLEKRYEYAYAQKVISDDLPFKYIFSAFWQEQEGSFLLWAFWHVVLGWILMYRAGKWEAPVLAVLALVQAFILSMILGIHFTDDFKIGSNPLLLLRDTMDIPLFQNADYVRLLSGNGLNPLLQNYWMTIHPPTLFLGFASTVVPFCYAVAGLWMREHKEWLKPVFPWALFSGAILGTGILMGGAWAYEALSFGGYWAWDPVENTSLVPWITLVAGIHTHLVARSTGYSYKSTYLFYLLTFVLILYSTFLTRSGVLGDTSVHAFTEMGLENQLLLFILTFAGMGAVMLFLRRKEIPAPQKEEALPSKEFWMFIGSLVLLFSAVLITASTSLPVVNKLVQLFNPEFKGYTLTDPVAHHNKYQLWIGVFIGLLSGGAQFLRYREMNWPANARKFATHTGIAAGVAALLTVATSLWIQLGQWQFWLLTFTGFFTVATNLDYLFSFLRGNLKAGGSVLAHVGFGLMIVGVVASGLNKQNISSNPMAQAGLLDEEMIEKNVLLFKEIPMYMSGYRVTYTGDSIVGNLRTFLVKYEKLDAEGDVQEEFTVAPAAVYNNQVTEVVAYNPSTKRYLGKDIFTHIATLPRREADFKFAKEQEDSLNYQTIELSSEPIALLDTVDTQSGKSVIETKVSIVDIDFQPTHPDYERQDGDFAASVKIAFQKQDTVFYAEPLIYLRGQLWGAFPVQLNDLSVKVRLPEEALFRLLESENQLDYQLFTFKQGESINLNGLNITFAGVNKNPDFEKQKDDVAVSAILEVKGGKESEPQIAEPVFLIRDGKIMTPKAEIPELGLHFYLSKINPATESFDVMIAQSKSSDIKSLPVEIAKKSYRTDYIVLEAIVFPGINFFWAGTILMMLGLAVSMFYRMKKG
jgi:cytochrome c-type biogenesis protein CcmF